MIFHLAAPYNITCAQIGLPCTKTPTLAAALKNASLLMIELVGLLSVIFIIYGGLQIVLSNGSPQRYARARETLVYAVAGLVVSISAFAIVTLVTNNVK